MPTDKSADSHLLAELNKLSVAGDNLAAAAAFVASEKDGTHRLRKAIADWHLAQAGIYGELHTIWCDRCKEIREHLGPVHTFECKECAQLPPQWWEIII